MNNNLIAVLMQLKEAKNTYFSAKNEIKRIEAILEQESKNIESRKPKAPQKPSIALMQKSQISLREYKDNHIVWENMLCFSCTSFIISLIACICSLIATSTTTFFVVVLIILMALSIAIGVISIIKPKRLMKRENERIAMDNAYIKEKYEKAIVKNEELYQKALNQYKISLSAYEDKCEEYKAYKAKLEMLISTCNITIQKCRDEAAANSYLSPYYSNFEFKYKTKHPIDAIIGYLNKGRSTTLTDAINLFEYEEKEAQRDQEERKHRSNIEIEVKRQREAAERAAKEAEREREIQLAASAAVIAQMQSIADATRAESESAQRLYDEARDKLKNI